MTVRREVAPGLHGIARVFVSGPEYAMRILSVLLIVALLDACAGGMGFRDEV